MFHSVLFVFVFSSSALFARKEPSLPTAEEDERISLKDVEVSEERKVFLLSGIEIRFLSPVDCRL